MFNLFHMLLHVIRFLHWDSQWDTEDMRFHDLDRGRVWDLDLLVYFPHLEIINQFIPPFKTFK